LRDPPTEKPSKWTVINDPQAATWEILLLKNPANPEDPPTEKPS